ncbi:hypothetical protein HNP32_003451 [Brevundimonas bullata]|uniref:Uncharacterized protein n=1 Tax=Brevundimonas bullata TaxID=13160 RepID=A0A7W7ISH8_9CAUL|nr:hypothetical protein [Brevundimonas bullata]MBB4799691.1 hypothetical protein [Brevundimonas bullata]MBB6384687.1 hypothetical protein [Brevundimonas bullata]
MADWFLTNWQTIYGIGALIAWALFALICFFGVWWFAAERYQFPGLALGWLPGAIAALTAAVVAAALWPLVVVGGIWIAAARSY